MLQMGVQKGTKVATILPNCIELLEIYWAAAKIGAIVVPMSTLLLANALRSLLNDSDAELIIGNTAFADILNQIKKDLTKVPADRYILTDATNTDGFGDYHALKAAEMGSLRDQLSDRTITDQHGREPGRHVQTLRQFSRKSSEGSNIEASVSLPID